MTVRTRQRDPEAEAAADKVVQSLSLRDEEKPVARLGALRGYRLGKDASQSKVEYLEGQLSRRDKTVAQLRDRVSTMSGFTAGEVRYIEVLHQYGMTVEEVADLFGTGVDPIKTALEEARNPTVRFGENLQPGAKPRMIQV